MITGRQIRGTRELLRWTRSRLAKAARLPLNAVLRAEYLDDAALITTIHADAIRGALESAGVELTDGN